MKLCKTGMRAQSYLFDRSQWTPAKAKRWLKAHGARAPKVDTTANKLRFRQRPTFHFKKGSFRTKTLSADMGIEAVVACPSGKYRGNDMPTIIALNPRPKRKKARSSTRTRKATKKGVSTMARRKRRTYRKRTVHYAPAAPRRRRTTHRRRRRNPAPRRRYARRAASYGRGVLGGIHLMNAVKTTIPMLLGAIAAQFSAKKFAEGGGSLENWGWKNYLLALAGGGVAAIATSAIIKGRANIAQHIFQGACLLVGYRLFTNELAPMNETMSRWFGEDMRLLPAGSPSYGDIWQGDQTDFVQGGDGFYRPIDESHRFPEMSGFNEVVPATASMGSFGELVPATASMGHFGADAASIAEEFSQGYR